MHSFLRITLLGVFGAIGVGLAVCLAMTSEPSADGQIVDAAAPFQDPLRGKAADPEAASPKTADSTASDVQGDKPFSETNPIGPVIAPYHPLVADQVRPNASGTRDGAQEHGHSFGPPATAGGAQTTAPRGDEPRVAQSAAAPRPSASLNEENGELQFNVQDTDIREVLDILSRQGNLNILASKNVQGKVSASLTDVDIDMALDAILRSTGFVARQEGNFIFVGLPEDFDEMDRSVDKVGTRVYRPNYVRATELQSLIAPMLSDDVGTMSVSTASEVGIASDASGSGGDAFAGSEVLLVRDYEAVLNQVDQVVDEVDRRPLQVSIEAMIMSVKLDDGSRLGVDFELLRDRNNIRLISGQPLSNLANMDLDDGGLNFGFLDSSLAVFLDALETMGDVNVIASPRLLCLNRQRAEIHIGRELGYISTTITENAATQTVEFLELGTQLRIRPFISSDGTIRLEIHPELSTGDVEIKGGFTVPDKEVTQVTTNVMVQDGSTIVLGGLIREDLKMNSSQIPLFGSLPVIGPAFRRKNEEIDRTELVILITPHIVSDSQLNCDGRQSESEFKRRQNGYKQKMNPIGMRFYGRRYFRMAESAWACGDAHSALRFVNVSIHFDPLSRQAHNLRAEIAASSPYGDNSVDSRYRVGWTLWRHPLCNGRLSPWLLDQLGENSWNNYPAVHSYDPGQPAAVREIEPPEVP